MTLCRWIIFLCPHAEHAFAEGPGFEGGERVLPSSLWLLGERHKRDHEEPGRLIERQPPEDWLVVTFAIARLWWRLREHLQLSTSLA